MTEEEKKAIDLLKFYEGFFKNIGHEEEVKSIESIINYIEKLQKENEEYKLLNANIEKANRIIEGKEKYISKDKIRDFIKCLEKDVENIREKKKNSHDYDRSSSRIQAYLTKTREIIKRLKKLLEED